MTGGARPTAGRMAWPRNCTRMVSDRSRLAADLDAAAARARGLETTNREVARRLDEAIDTIRSVLAAGEP